MGSPYHYFAYMVKGTAKIISNDKTVFIKEGDLFYIPKNTCYQSYWYGDDEITFFSYGCNNLLADDTNFLDLQIIEAPSQMAIELTSIPTNGTNVQTKEIGSFFSAVANLLPYMKKLPVSSANLALIKAKKYLSIKPNCSNAQLAEACKISIP